MQKVQREIRHRQMKPWVYIEITCIKCAVYIAHGHVRNGHSFSRVRDMVFKEAKEKKAVMDEETGEVTCIKCLTPMSERPIEWFDG